MNAASCLAATNEAGRRVKCCQSRQIRGAPPCLHRVVEPRAVTCAWVQTEAVGAGRDFWAANRRLAIAKFREKRKARSFDKKVRYESRRRLAETRPRVRGQFVRAAVPGEAQQEVPLAA